MAAVLAVMFTGLATPASAAPAASTSPTAIPVPDNTEHLFTSVDGHYLYGLSATSDMMTVIDLRTDKMVKSVTLGGQGTDLANDPSGKYVYVTNPDVGNIYQIDAATRTVVQQLHVGGPLDALGPMAVRSTAGGDVVYIAAEYRDFLYTVDVATKKVGKITVADEPASVNLAGSQLVVGHNDSDVVEQIDTATNKVVARRHNRYQTPVAAAATVGPHTVAITGFGATQWYDTNRRRFVAGVPATFPGNLQAVTGADNGRYTLIAAAAFPDSPRAYDGTITVVDNADLTTRRVFQVGPFPWGMASGSGKVVVPEVPEVGGVGTTRLLIYPLDQVTAPATVTLDTARARAGARIGAHAVGFGPQESVLATLRSKPVRVAKATVANDTRAQFRFTVPRGLSAGRHTLTVTGSITGITATVALTIVAAPSSSTPATTSSSAARSAPSTPSSTPLANTGTQTTSLTTTGIALVLAGAGVLLLARRRRTARHR